MQGWAAPSTLTFLVVAVVLLVAFVLWEQRASNPMLPLRVVLDRNRGGSFLVFLLVGAGLFAMFLFLTYYFQVNLGYTPLKAGFAFLPFSLGIILAAGVVAQLLPRVGPKPLMVPGLAMAVVGMLLLTRIDQDTSYWALVFPAMLLMTVGLAGVFIPASSTALVGVGHHDAGVASAVLNTSQQIGGSLGTALLNTLFAGAVTATSRTTRRPAPSRRSSPAARAHPRLPRGVLLGRRPLRGRPAGVDLRHQRAEGGHPLRRGRGGRLMCWGTKWSDVFRGFPSGHRRRGLNQAPLRDR